MTKTECLAYKEEEGQEKLWRLFEDPTAPLAVDTETTGLKVASGLSDYVIGVSIASVVNGEPISHYYPTAHLVGENCNGETLDLLNQVLTQTGRPLLFVNVQFDMLGLLHAGFDCIQQEFYDVPTMANLVNENTPKTKSLDQLSKHYLGDEEGKVNDPFVEKEKKSGNQNITGEQMFEYAVVDAELTYRVWCELIGHPEWVHLSDHTDVWEEKQKVIRVLIALRQRGVLLDTELTTELEALGTEHMARLREKIKFNPGSNKDMHRIFIEELKFPILKKSKKTGAPSFDNEVMEQYDVLLEEMDSPLAKDIREYRGWQKATTACYRPYLALQDDDGRVRCTFNTHRTTTGRLSSSDPNLQQIPKESVKQWNGRVRECFIASPGYTMMSFDYAQLEYRLLTVYTGDENLREVFATGRDIFAEMALTMGMERGKAKVFVHSTNYGAGAKKHMVTFKVTQKVAEGMLNTYRANYPKIAAFNSHCRERAERDMKCKLWSGRFRHFQYKSESYKAMNSVIQGGCADIMERVMVRVFDETEGDDCHMLLQVHDELVFEVLIGTEEHYARKIKALMEDVNGVIPSRLSGSFDVKFNVEAKPWTK